MNALSGTKELIFDAFVEMTSALGYENVAMRDIADKVGIQVASIYNHFESKQKLLEFTYDYYTEHRFNNRKPVEEMKKIIETCGAEVICRSFLFTFETDVPKRYMRMVLITKIIYMRMFQDPIANRLFLDQFTNNAAYMLEVLKHGVEIGRIHPGFDIVTFADIFIGAISNMGIRSFASADYVVGQLEQEKLILAIHAKLLSTALM